jgi:peroxiredoxin family protein
MRRFAMVSGRGHASPRASTVCTRSIVTAPSYSLAAILSSGEPERLYTGLSLLVTTAAGGERCAGLATFRGLELLLDPELRGRALTALPDETFARSLHELRAAALELEALDLYACPASVDALGVEPGDLEVMSTPRFLAATAGARLVVV